MNIIDENNYTQEGGEGFFLGVFSSFKTLMLNWVFRVFIFLSKR